MIYSEHGGNFLTFDDVNHRYTLNGEPAVGVTTFIKGGMPTSQGIINWNITEGSAYTAKLLARLARDKKIRLKRKTLDEIIKRSKQAPKKTSKKAADIGTIVHDYAYYTELGEPEKAEKVLEQIKPEDREKANNGIQKFKEWKAKNKDKIIATEAIVAHVCQAHETGTGLCLCFGGKFDRLARRGRRVVLSDFKTSSGIYVDQFVQLGAYAYAIEEWMDLKVDIVEILRFGKENGEFEVKAFKTKDAIEDFKREALVCRETFEFNKVWGKKINKFYGGIG